MQARQTLAGCVLVVSSAALLACSGSKNNDAGTFPDAEDPRDAGVVAEAGRPRDANVVPLNDAGFVVAHDSGLPQTCTRTCDCPQGLACLNGLCRTAGVGPVWCCTKPGCPAGEACLGANDNPNTCPHPPDAGPDAGAADLGAGAIGASCTTPADCDQSRGFTCWDRTVVPLLWGGYCTLPECDPVCPSGSECITYAQGTPNEATGCFQSCVLDSDCRSDAYCLAVPMSTIRICLPDCRDDVFDCAPRDGTQYCSPTTGRCDRATTHMAGAAVGDPCADSRSCAAGGQVCLGEAGWGVPGGMCTRICSVLPEATPCGPNETCQMVAGVGMCFRNCVNNACPNRPGAMCTRLVATWAQPSCVPQ